MRTVENGNCLRYTSGHYEIVGGTYNPFLNIISFPKYRSKELFGSKLRYNLTDKEFLANIDLIEMILTYHHESTHFYQTLGTLNGFFLIECYLIFLTSVFTWCGQLRYEVPLREFINSIPGREDLEIEPYYQFIRGNLYKFLIDWIQGSRRYKRLSVQMSANELTLSRRRLIYGSEEVDDAWGMKPKFLPQVYVWDERAGLTYTMFLGSYSLMEAFARSVEYEHLLWFNHNGFVKLFEDFESNPENLVYTLPEKLMRALVPHDYLESTRFYRATLRVLCDIALMFNDCVLDYYDADFTGNYDEGPFLAAGVHPGETFLKALRVLPNVPPMRDHEADLMRFYNDVCEKMCIPTHEKMVDRGIKAISDRIKRFPDNHIARFVCEGFLRGLQLRRENPLFFVNDLIHSDKCKTVGSRLDNVCHFADAEGFLAGSVRSALHITVAADVVNQLFNESIVSCPIPQLFGEEECPYEKGKKCHNSFPDTEEFSDIDCAYFDLVGPIYKNACVMTVG